jgi:hypothetical protein
MKDLIRLASLLDRNGNYLLADKLDKIAQNIQENPQDVYKEAINDYKQALENKHPNPDAFIEDFNNWCNSNFNKTNDPNNKQYYQQLKFRFGKHAERLKIYYSNKENTFQTDNSLLSSINEYGLYKAKNVNDFNNRWKQYTDYLKRVKFKGSPGNAPTIYYSPGVQQQLAALYEQLRSHYTNPVKYKPPITKNVPNTMNWSIDANGELSNSIPDSYS